MLCLMFECQDRGVLSAGGVPWSDEEVAAAVSGDTTANLACIRELIAKGVANRNSSGAIFSRRLVRDETKRTGDRDRKRQERLSNGCPSDVTQDVTALSEEEREAVGVEVGFDSFWKVYPKRVGKISAFRAWRKIPSVKEHALEILEGVERWKLSQQWQDTQFIPYPATFLNDRRWEAEVPANGTRELSKTQQGKVPLYDAIQNAGAKVSEAYLKKLEERAAKKAL